MGTVTGFTADMMVIPMEPQKIISKIDNMIGLWAQTADTDNAKSKDCRDGSSNEGPNAGK